MIASNNQAPFTYLQDEIIEREFRFQFEAAKIEIEKIEKEDNYVIYILLAAIEIDIKEMIDKIVRECNQFGNFIRPQVLITNTKILSREEIIKNLNGNTQSSTTEPDQLTAI